MLDYLSRVVHHLQKVFGKSGWKAVSGFRGHFSVNGTDLCNGFLKHHTHRLMAEYNGIVLFKQKLEIYISDKNIDIWVGNFAVPFKMFRLFWKFCGRVNQNSHTIYRSLHSNWNFLTYFVVNGKHSIIFGQFSAQFSLHVKCWKGKGEGRCKWEHGLVPATHLKVTGRGEKKYHELPVVSRPTYNASPLPAFSPIHITCKQIPWSQSPEISPAPPPSPPFVFRYDGCVERAGNSTGSPS